MDCIHFIEAVQKGNHFVFVYPSLSQFLWNTCPLIQFTLQTASSGTGRPPVGNPRCRLKVYWSRKAAIWNDRGTGLPAVSNVCTSSCFGLFPKPTVMKPGCTSSPSALPIVPAKLVLTSPCNGIFQVMTYSFEPTSLHESIRYPRTTPPSALITQAKRFSNPF